MDVMQTGTEFVKQLFLTTHFSMNKFWLILSAVVYSCASLAQPSSQKEANSFFTDISCSVKGTNTVDLQWKIYNDDQGDYFIVERSTDGEHFETVGAMKISDTTTSYNLSDNPSYNGVNFYRVKYTSKAGKFIYSKTVQATLAGAVDFKFYPNPVDKLLIIQTAHSIDVQILDAAGGLRVTKDLQPGLQIINISNLEKGSYVLKVADKQSNRVVSEQLLKN